MLPTGQVSWHGHLRSVPVLSIGEYVKNKHSTAVIADSAGEEQRCEVILLHNTSPLVVKEKHRSCRYVDRTKKSAPVREILQIFSFLTEREICPVPLEASVFTVLIFLPARGEAPFRCS
jgi:hypothetical protein